MVEGRSVFAKISARELTRIKVQNGRIENVRGLQGEITIDKDVETGEVYIRPVHPAKVVNLFVTTDSGQTHTLVLQPQDVPAQTLILKEMHRRLPAERAPGTASFHKEIKDMIVALARDEMPRGVEVEEVGRRVPLWKDTTYVLERRHKTTDRIAEKYSFTNQTGETMVLSEPEFYADGVLAVSIEHMQLAPQATTNVFIVRKRGGND